MGNRGLGLITKQKIWSEYRYACQNCVEVVGALIRLIFHLCKRKWDGLSQWPQRLSLRANEVTQHSPYSSLTVHLCLNVPAALWNIFIQLHFGFSASYTHCENTHFTLIVCLLALALSGSYVKIFIFNLWNSVTPAYTNHTYTHHIAYSRKLTSFCSVHAGFDSFAVCHRFVTVLIVPDRHLFLTLSVSLWWNHIPIISSLADPGRCTARWEVKRWVREFVERQGPVMLQLFFTYSTPWFSVFSAWFINDV